MHPATTLRPAALVVRPAHPIEQGVELDNPAITRLVQIGIAMVMGTTLVVFHNALIAMATAALPFA